MQTTHDHSTLEDAGEKLLPMAIRAENWVPGQDGRLSLPHFLQARAEGVRVSACISIGPELEVELRISFRGSHLSLGTAAELLERFVARAIPLAPNTEWRVEVDPRRRVTFCRRWAPDALQG